MIVVAMKFMYTRARKYSTIDRPLGRREGGMTKNHSLCHTPNITVLIFNYLQLLKRERKAPVAEHWNHGSHRAVQGRADLGRAVMPAGESDPLASVVPVQHGQSLLPPQEVSRRPSLHMFIESRQT